MYMYIHTRTELGQHLVLYLFDLTSAHYTLELIFLLGVPLSHCTIPSSDILLAFHINRHIAYSYSSSETLSSDILTDASAVSNSPLEIDFKNSLYLSLAC